MLIEIYLGQLDHSGLLDVEELVNLICKEETNAFGLYPGDTGVFLLPDPLQSKCETYMTLLMNEY